MTNGTEKKVQVPRKMMVENTSEKKAGFNEMVLIAATIRYDMYATLHSFICSYLVGLGEKLGKLTGREPQNRQFQLVWPIEGGSRC